MLRDSIKQAFADALKTPNFPLLKPAYNHFGDYAVNIMNIEPRPTEADISDIIDTLKSNPLFEDVSRKGAFINVFISRTSLITELKEALEKKDRYGSLEFGSGKTWGIEHTSPNPNKAMHLGHLRNNVTGMAIANLAEFSGFTVIRDGVDNNRGIAIARLMWGYLKYGHIRGEKNHNLDYWYDHRDEWDLPSEHEHNPGAFVDQLYVKASGAYKTNEKAEREIRQMVVDWEREDPKTWELWKTVLAYSYDAQERTLRRLGNKWDRVWHEHDHYKTGKEYVEEGLKNGIFKKTEENTVITQLEKDYALPDTVLMKSDGTSLYITQDIALTDLKMKEYKPDRLLWVVGPEQSLAMKQMFAVCEQLGIGALHQFAHISYGYMSIKGSGKMSSRLGNVVYIDDLLDSAVQKARDMIRNPDDIDVDAVAQSVGVGAVKYSLLKVGRQQDIEFDIDQSLSFEGNSGPYIQYTHARIWGILSAAGFGKHGFETQHPSADSVNKENHVGLLEESADFLVKPSVDVLSCLAPEELRLLRTLQRFPEVVYDAAMTYSPHAICTYLFDLTQAFNAFYEEHRIVDADEPSRALRLALTQASAHVISNGLRLLGITAPLKM